MSTGIPFLDHLGLRIEEAGHGQATLILELQPEHCNSLRAAHGGVVMTLLDVAMARAARALARQQGEDDHGVVTIEMKASFMKAGTGARLLARGHCVHRTRGGMAFCEAEVHDETGELLARSMGTFKYVRARAIAHRAPR